MSVDVKLGSMEEKYWVLGCVSFFITTCVPCMQTTEYAGFERALFKQIKSSISKLTSLYFDDTGSMSWFMC